ncbi:MAG TPA: ATP-binding protein [Haliscomenobacter sp.]|uniref:tetratricopeptide repeat-containing sensor histidine kinase n=1 Tax=Haliscomenobacter sp. TaxID=2717303 RepID=UPI002BB9F57B|nr:ATP-binding protein [Haliscomenobacter sp.]HOY16673.1 ATP-binding protein [Haliscomenobacter sp.]
MKRLNFILLFTLLFTLHADIGFAQIMVIDSLKHELAIVKQDTSRVLILAELCYAYRNIKPDKSLLIGQKALVLARKIQFLKGESRVLNYVGNIFRTLGDLPKSLDYHFKGLKIAEKNNYSLEAARCLVGIGLIYKDLKDYSRAINYIKKARKINELIQDERLATSIGFNLGGVYQQNNQLDSALAIAQEAYNNVTLINSKKFTSDLDAPLAELIGIIQFQLGNHLLAFDYMHKCLMLQQKRRSSRGLAGGYNTMAEFFKKINQADSSIYFAKLGLLEAQAISNREEIVDNSNLLADLYEQRDLKKTLYYYKLAKTTSDEIFGVKKISGLQKMIAEEQERHREAESQKIAFQNQLKQYAFLGGLAILFLIAYVLYRNNQKEKKAKTILEEKNKVIEQTLTELKSTQAQLIQSEKLASLGELTAGIAHEIQNPLNFVNNFSELNRELIIEMKEEIEKGNYGEVKVIAEDLETNEERINHHGQRASSIVKGMLEHSRASTGVKEPTDLNALADEYLRLAYHGLLAKDNRFNATLETRFDPDLPLVSVIPQDIGRVFLNLINNAFYAVAERSRSTVNEKAKQGIEGYQPTVMISTRKLEYAIEIRVEDNGNGIPEAIRDKIFQPFFTTKPTGQGTGLGLSLAYDIVTKGHGGILEVASTDGTSRDNREGGGAEFIITLPSKTN